MRDMVMQMTGSGGVFSVPNEHLPGLIALVLIGPAVWVALAGLRALDARRVPWASQAQRRLDALPFAGKVVLLGTLVGALVHAVIVPTHWGDARVTAILFIVDTIGFVVAFWWTFTARRHWQLVSVTMLAGTACFYALYILTGWETMDLVGLVTTTLEAAAALIVLSPAAAGSGSVARQHAVALAAVPVALASLLGTNLIAGATTTPPATAAPVKPAPTSSSSSGECRVRPQATPPSLCRPRRWRATSNGLTTWPPWRRGWRWRSRIAPLNRPRRRSKRP
jgi:hypothetical protein